MKKYILFSIFAFSALIFTSCSDNALIDSIDEKEILDPNFSYIQVYVYTADNSTQSSQSNSNGQSCGSSCGNSCGNSTQANSSMQDVEVSLYANLANMTNDLGPEISISTNSRGVARFDYLENTSYYIFVKSTDGEKTLFVQTKKGELVRTSVGF